MYYSQKIIKLHSDRTQVIYTHRILHFDDNFLDNYCRTAYQDNLVIRNSADKAYDTYYVPVIGGIHYSKANPLD
jgi:hypothetical protein